MKESNASLWTRLFSYVPLLGLFAIFFGAISFFDGYGCSPAKPECTTAADCPGQNMICENAKCKTGSNPDGGEQKDTNPPTDNGPKPDTNTNPDTNKPDNSNPGKAEVGKPCNQNSDCVSGAICLDPGGLGTKICTNNCANTTACGQHFCDIHSGLKNGLCLPKCTTDANCADYAPMTLCVSEGHCWKAGDIGALCNDKSECKDTAGSCVDPGGFGPKICTKQCTSDADCGSIGICDQHPGITTRYCLPKCAVDSDCQYAHMNLCAEGKHCWRKAGLGSLCFQTRECLDGLACADPGGLGPNICHKHGCTSDADCTVDGVPGKCADPGSGTKSCLPTCTGDNDCVGFPHMPKCTNNYCWK